MLCHTREIYLDVIMMLNIPYLDYLQLTVCLFFNLKTKNDFCLSVCFFACLFVLSHSLFVIQSLFVCLFFMFWLEICYLDHSAKIKNKYVFFFTFLRGQIWPQYGIEICDINLSWNDLPSIGKKPHTTL